MHSPCVQGRFSGAIVRMHVPRPLILPGMGCILKTGWVGALLLKLRLRLT
jgi:hypothetical protein